jgi:hypothetical protein
VSETHFQKQELSMTFARRTLVFTFAALLVCSVPLVRAQTGADPSGHWTGALQSPDREMSFEVDLTKNAKGEVAGTMNIPDEHLQGLPLLTTEIKGKAIKFSARKDQSFAGDLAPDGKSITGIFTGIGPLGGEFTVPFVLNRTGAAKIEAPIQSAAISKELAGTWSATIQKKSDGSLVHFTLMLANHNGVGTGRFVAVDEGGLELPVAITQKGANVTLDIKAIHGTIVGTLNPAGTELVGTFTQGPGVAPVTFKRVADGDAKKSTEAKK